MLRSVDFASPKMTGSKTRGIPLNSASKSLRSPRKLGGFLLKKYATSRRNVSSFEKFATVLLPKGGYQVQPVDFTLPKIARSEESRRSGNRLRATTAGGASVLSYPFFR